MEAKKIVKLDEQTIHRIAAGEVVQAPSAALKELIENSLDAGSTRIQVVGDDGGLGLLSVTDNGHGIRVEDFPLVCTRFATSKLTEIGDLDSLTTFGFRGEALAALSYCAHVRITSRHRDSCINNGTRNIAAAAAVVAATSSCFDGGDGGSGVAYVADFRDGVMISTAPRPVAQADAGTTVVVENLFYNAPLRRKAYGRTNDEWQRIVDIVAKYALQNPSVGFSCMKHGAAKMDVALPPNSTFAAVVAAKFGGSNVASHLRPLVDDHREKVDEILRASAANTNTNSSSSNNSNKITEEALLSFSFRGYHTDLPFCSMARKGTLIVFVNGRLVECSSVKRVMDMAYSPYLVGSAKGWWAFVSITVASKFVDVNVHPTKHEVMLLHESAIVSAIFDSLRRSLLANLNAQQTVSTKAAAVSASSFVATQSTGSTQQQQQQKIGAIAPSGIARVNEQKGAILKFLVPKAELEKQKKQKKEEEEEEEEEEEQERKALMNSNNQKDSAPGGDVENDDDNGNRDDAVQTTQSTSRSSTQLATQFRTSETTLKTNNNNSSSSDDDEDALLLGRPPSSAQQPLLLGMDLFGAVGVVVPSSATIETAALPSRRQRDQDKQEKDAAKSPLQQQQQQKQNTQQQQPRTEPKSIDFLKMIDDACGCCGHDDEDGNGDDGSATTTSTSTTKKLFSSSTVGPMKGFNFSASRGGDDNDEDDGDAAEKDDMDQIFADFMRQRKQAEQAEKEAAVKRLAEDKKHRNNDEAMAHVIKKEDELKQKKAERQDGSSSMVEVEDVLESVLELRDSFVDAASRNFAPLLGRAVIVGALDAQRALIQCSTTLLLIDTPGTLFHLAEQRIFSPPGWCKLPRWSFEEDVDVYAVLVKCLKMPVFRAQLLSAADEGERRISQVARKLVGRLLEWAEMLDEYFAIEIVQQQQQQEQEPVDDGKVVLLKALPAVFGDGLEVCVELVGPFLLRLATEVRFDDEKECLRGIARELSLLYAASASRVADGQVLLRDVVVPALRSPHFVAVEEMVRNHIVQPLVSTEQLYRVFERC